HRPRACKKAAGWLVATFFGSTSRAARQFTQRLPGGDPNSHGSRQKYGRQVEVSIALSRLPSRDDSGPHSCAGLEAVNHSSAAIRSSCCGCQMRITLLVADPSSMIPAYDAAREKKASLRSPDLHRRRGANRRRRLYARRVLPEPG